MENLRTKSLVYNAIKTPDGTILESTERNDCRTYKDKNGKVYMIDGGLDYIRCSGHPDEESLAVWSDEPHEKVRKYAFRIGYGKSTDPDFGKLRLTRVRNMEDTYLANAIKYCTKPSNHLTLLMNEVKYRLDQKNKAHGNPTSSN